MRSLILLCILSTATAARWQSDSRIVGGSATNIQQYPFMSNMQHGIKGLWWNQACGGSLITTNSVLSAAHCYYGDAPSSWRVILGTSYASSGGTTYSVSQLILHESYNYYTSENDIAIVKLANPASISYNVGLARLPDASYNLPDGSTITAIGWGTFSPGGSQPEQLQHVDIKVINQGLCTQRYSYLKTVPGFENWPSVTHNMMCTGMLNVGGKGTCQGDAGGPVTINRNMVVGITSWGYSCADGNYPGVNTRVSRYTQWIYSHTTSVCLSL